jgi:hypothetical protein
LAVDESSEPTNTDAKPEPTFTWILDCPCGTRLSGASEDEIVDVSLAHLADKHPDMSYEREHVLFMAVKYKR